MDRGSRVPGDDLNYYLGQFFRAGATLGETFHERALNSAFRAVGGHPI